MSGFDFNVVLVPLLGIFGILAIFSGGFLIIRSILRFRIAVSQSMQMDLEVVKVSRIKRSQEAQQNQSADAWREQIRRGKRPSSSSKRLLRNRIAVRNGKRVLGSSGFIKCQTLYLKLPTHQIAKRFFSIYPCRSDSGKILKNSYTVFFLRLLLKKFLIIPYFLRIVRQR